MHVMDWAKVQREDPALSAVLDWLEVQKKTHLKALLVRPCLQQRRPTDSMNFQNFTIYQGAFYLCSMPLERVRLKIYYSL